MGGLALIARELGHEVTGSDENIYPPMSDQLAAQGVEVMAGYEPAHLIPAPDCVVVGNALSRGNPAVEHLLEAGLPYTSGPAWLADNVLQGRHVLAVAGTHGKTTTTGMLAWILESAGHQPGFLVGGAPGNFPVCARLGAKPVFVVEADEYDTAFFDKRSKFVHYRPRTLAITNIEHDHADIFADNEAIVQQFHHLVRTVPGGGRIVRRGSDPLIDTVLERGCWTPVQDFGPGEARWRAGLDAPDGSVFQVLKGGETVGTVSWSLFGAHNVENALAAIAAADHAGVSVEKACEALGSFRNSRRRLELIADVGGRQIYDDFAHHPTAMAATLTAMRAKKPGQRVLAIVEPRSNTMRMGTHRHRLADALSGAERVWFFKSADLAWNPAEIFPADDACARVHEDIEAIITEVTQDARPGDQIIIMSNGAFGGIHHRLIDALRDKHEQ